MRAITLPEFGGTEVLTVSDISAPQLRPEHVLIDVVTAGVNRADIMQRRGFYPPPAGESEVPGLEVSGVIAAVGEGVSQWEVGDEVCALLAGGGYAEQVVVPQGQVLHVPKDIDLRDAAALPEVVCTVWSNLAMTAGLQAGQSVLIHGGSSGIGTMAIQVARQIGAHVAVTAGSSAKLEACRQLGASTLINYREQDFTSEIHAATGGHGADVILDVVGAKYLSANIQALATNGRLVVIGLLGGRTGEVDLATLLAKRGSLMATGLRARPAEDKAAIVTQVREHVWPWIADGRVRPLVHSRHRLEDVAAAHQEMEESTHIGKIVLDVR